MQAFRNTMEKHWLSIEKLVHLIEKSISPDSRVEHNVMMPDLTSSSNKTRQCDIVITSGTPKRPTITIVEVQNRVSKLDINTFQGFERKMEDVGAQHLICVSKKGFGKTIIEKAKNSGGKIRLVTLSKYAPESFPIALPKLDVISNLSKITKVEFIDFSFKSDKEVGIYVDKVEFEIPQLNQKFNYLSLSQFFLSNIIKPEKSGIVITMLPNQVFDLNMYHENECYKVDLFKWKIFYEVTTTEIPVYCYSYEQLGTGAMAWVLESLSEVNGKTRIVRMPLVQNEDGTFQFSLLISE